MPAKPQKCKENRTLGNMPERQCGGDGGIRTLDGLLTHTHFPGERLRPLGHVSASWMARPIA